MKLDAQYPDDTTIPTTPGYILASQVNAVRVDIDDALVIADKPLPSEMRHRMRHALGRPIPDQDAETLALVRGSVEARRKRVVQHERKMEAQRKRRGKRK